jgi:hypothetical protein
MRRTLLRRPTLALLLALSFAHNIGAQKQLPGPSSVPGPNQGPTVRLYELRSSPETLDFGAVPEGQEPSLDVTLRNTGIYPLHLTRVAFLLGASGNSAAFRVTLGGNTYTGGVANVFRTIQPPVLIGRGQTVTATVTFEPSEEVLDAFDLRFEGTGGAVDVTAVSGLGGHAGDPYLHVTIEGPEWLVDYDQDGSEGASLDGTGSHTHEPGHALSAYEWRVEGQVVASTATASFQVDSSEVDVELEIFDDNDPVRSLVGHHDLRLVAPDQVPGALASYYDASASGPTALLEAVPAAPDFLEQRPSFAVSGTGLVGGSPFSSNVLVRIQARTTLAQNGLFTWTATGGVDRRVYIDGELVTVPTFFFAGPHEIDVRYAVETLADLPLDLELYVGGSGGPLTEAQLSHDETTVEPVIHAMTEAGAITGGDPIAIDGFGFFPPQQVVVHWGDMDLIAADFTLLTPKRIEFPSPPGGGAIAVSVENMNGTSNVKTFLYQLNGPPPIQFRRDLIVAVPGPTAGVFGPDGTLYVASLDGRISVLTFDEDYELLSQTIHAGVSGLTNPDTLSIAINPFDPPSPVKLYVGHGDHFLHGGQTPTGPSPYTGQISVLTGPDFDIPVPLVTGLPVSNHDHGINGIAFDNNGDLLISVGSMTNAGVAAFNSGDLPESPLSAAVLKARLSDPTFNGAVTYVETATGLPNDDQRDGEEVDVAAGVDVEVHASGLRNAYGLVYTTKGRLYATDNGPNVGFGPASTGPHTQSSDPYDDDELNLIEWGNYYGSPNRSRGRTDARQNVYYAGLSGPASIPDTLFQMIAWLPPSSDGIDEYRADTFAGQMRGELIVQRYLNKLRRVRLRTDGRASTGQSQIDPNPLGLGCVTGPGGVIMSLDHGGGEIEVFEPDDLTPAQLVVHDIHPWRAPATGGTPFVIAGRGFGTLGTTSVTIGGQPATLTNVGWGRIHGLFPAEAAPITGLLDVAVTVGTEEDVLPAAFRYLLPAGTEPGRWETLQPVGTALGEVAAGVIGGTMYLVGENSSATFAFDLLNRQWLANKATRPFVGHHHAAEVHGGKLYLIGGLTGGSEGIVQIYDPSSNTWTTGASMPWSAGSVSTALIDGVIYAAGGIVTAGYTVSNCAAYDIATDTWSTLPSMPDSGRNHAAAGTDGELFWVFGGRRGGNFVTNGYWSIMVFDPATSTWTWNGEPGSSLPNFPQRRGGMGKAVWLRGEFYVFGGETLDDPGANPNGVFDRVDVFNPLTNTWRLEAQMPNARHGIFPVLFQGHIFIAGGGTQSGYSQSTIFDTFTRQ